MTGHEIAHEDLIKSAVNYLEQARLSLTRQYKDHHSDRWSYDEPLITAYELAGHAIQILLAESRPAAPLGVAAAPPPADGVAAARPTPTRGPAGGAGPNTTPADFIAPCAYIGGSESLTSVRLAVHHAINRRD